MVVDAVFAGVHHWTSARFRSRNGSRSNHSTREGQSSQFVHVLRRVLACLFGAHLRVSSPSLEIPRTSPHKLVFRFGEWRAHGVHHLRRNDTDHTNQYPTRNAVNVDGRLHVGCHGDHRLS